MRIQQSNIPSHHPSPIPPSRLLGQFYYYCLACKTAYSSIPQQLTDDRHSTPDFYILNPSLSKHSVSSPWSVWFLQWNKHQCNASDWRQDDRQSTLDVYVINSCWWFCRSQAKWNMCRTKEVSSHPCTTSKNPLDPSQLLNYHTKSTVKGDLSLETINSF